MSDIKERILGAISIMNDDDAEIVWELILTHFPKRSWSDIETVVPDEWDKKMLADIENDSNCKEFVSADEAMKQLGLK